MKKSAILLLSLMTSTVTLGSPTLIGSDIEEATSYYGGQHRISVETTVSAKANGFVMPETRARAKAIKFAEENGNEVLKSICVNGFVDERSFSDTKECTVVDADKNKVECTVTTNALCNNFVGVKSKPGLRLKLGKIAPSTACINKIDEKFSIDSDVINNCNKIKNELQFECVELISNYNSVKVFAIAKCAKFESVHAINTLRYYAGVVEGSSAYEAPGVPTIKAISLVDSKEEETCFINKMKLGSLSSADLIKSCTNEIEEATDSAVERAGSIFDAIGDFFRN